MSSYQSLLLALAVAFTMDGARGAESAQSDEADAAVPKLSWSAFEAFLAKSQKRCRFDLKGSLTLGIFSDTSCSAVLIGNQWFATAKHCVEKGGVGKVPAGSVIFPAAERFGSEYGYPDGGCILDPKADLAQCLLSSSPNLQEDVASGGLREDTEYCLTTINSSRLKSVTGFWVKTKKIQQSGCQNVYASKKYAIPGDSGSAVFLFDSWGNRRLVGLVVGWGSANLKRTACVEFFP